jgi:hypothetical protein
MGYIPKFIHFDHFITVEYPFGVYWKHSYIQQSIKVCMDISGNINNDKKRSTRISSIKG